MEIMNRTGITLFLDMDPSLLVRRLSVSMTVRPLISQKSKQELLSFISENLKKRRPFYEKARFSICDPDLQPSEILKMIGRI
jgi:shikimate kinase